MSEYKETFTRDRFNLVHETSHQLNYRARLAEILLGHMAVVVTHGEEKYTNSSDVEIKTSKFLPVEELANRACDLADAVVTQFEQRGWMIEVQQKLEK